ncbi:hypothetical protein BCD64_05995 [Nostoc sp. MBR 210]|nr:hypothetical protein BCD64_05995 [Nostoc sp. MBR 210]
MAYLLDTNIVTYILKKNQIIDNKIWELRRLKQDILVQDFVFAKVLKIYKFILSSLIDKRFS